MQQEVVFVSQEKLTTENVVDCHWIECTNPFYKGIFEEEKLKGGLESLDILLLVPQLNDRINPDSRGLSGKLISGTYIVGINPPPRNSRFYNPYRDDERRTIRHEIAHIKFGDCDRELPWLLGKLFHIAIEEPRANLYETMPN